MTRLADALKRASADAQTTVTAPTNVTVTAQATESVSVPLPVPVPVPGAVAVALTTQTTEQVTPPVALPEPPAPAAVIVAREPDRLTARIAIEVPPATRAVVATVPESKALAPSPPPDESLAAGSPDSADLTAHRWFADQIVGTHEDPHETRGGPKKFSPRLREKLVTDPKSRAAAVEQYRRLAAALHHSQQQFGTKVVMVASALGGEGKSLSACNLALTLSHSYRRRVLLIDADLRRPSLHEMFQLPATWGLSEGLRGSSERAFPLFEVSSRLMVLPSGRPDPDPIGGLASERMTRIVAEAASLFDWVLIDSPPVGLVPDAKVLSALVDAAVLVIRAGKSPCAMVRHAIDALGPEKIFGVVLNAAETASTLHRSGYYGAERG